MVKNKDITEWCENVKNYANGLYLVQVGKLRIPVSNQICPICKKGWNAPFRFAVKENVVYHFLCLQSKGLLDKDVIHE